MVSKLQNDGGNLSKFSSFAQGIMTTRTVNPFQVKIVTGDNKLKTNILERTLTIG